MRNSKKISWLLFYFFVISMNCTQAENSLTVKLKDGTETNYLLRTLDKITFSGSNLVLKNVDASTNAYLGSTVRRLTFGIYSAVSNVLSDQTSIMVYPSPASDVLMLKNAPDEVLNIMVIRLDGVVLINEKLFSNKTPIDISSLVSGFYLLKVNNVTLKFTKQ